MNYFHIKQKRGRKTVFSVFSTDYKVCTHIAGFPSEDAAKAKVRELKKVRL